MTTSIQRLRRRQNLVAPAARRQGNVLSRRQLYALGLTRREVAAEIAAGHWSRFGSECVLAGPEDSTSLWWRALLETGPAAVLDGVSALLVAGLRTIEADAIHVAVPQGAWYRERRGVRVHETRRFREEDVLPERHSADDAGDGRRACRPLGSQRPASGAVRRRSRSATHHQRARALQRREPHQAGSAAATAGGLVSDVAAGVESLGERDFALGCRQRGFPEPTRQELRVLPPGRRFYDVVWKG